MASKQHRRKKRSQGIVAALRDPDKIRIAYIVAGLALVFGGSLGFGSSNCGKKASQNQTDTSDKSIIASIEDHDIYYRDYYKDLESMRRRTEASDDSILHPEEWEANLNYTVLRQMIDMEYFDIRANDVGIVVTPEDVETELNGYKSQLMPAQKQEEARSILQRIGDALGTVKEDSAFELALKSRIDPELTVAKLREIIRQNLLAQKYVAQITSEKDAEVMTEIQDRAEKLKTEITEGKDFSLAAMENSEHEDTKGKGGFLAGVKKGITTVPDVVIDRALTEPLDVVSEPLTTNQEGFKGAWLIKVVSRKTASGDEWEAAQADLNTRLLEEKRKKIEAGEMEMPADENLTVSNEELVAAYEEADINLIYLAASKDEPVARVTEAVRKDQENMRIVIFDPEIRAMHHIVMASQFDNPKGWDLAAADYQEALDEVAKEYDPETGGAYALELGEARLRYLIANLWATRAFSIESAWFQEIWAEFQSNQSAFDGSFPELPTEIKEEQQGYFVIALRNLDRAIELDSSDPDVTARDPWNHMQRAQIFLAREQLSQSLIDDLTTADEFSSDDLTLENRILSSINQAIALDDKALETAGFVRPDTWTDPVLPEDTLQITLEQLDEPFKALIPEVTAKSDDESEPDSETPAADVESNEQPEVTEAPVVDEGTSVAEVEDAVADEPTEEPYIGVEIPSVPVAVANGPLSQDMRDKLNDLLVVVQAKVDRLTAEKEKKEADQKALMDQQIQQLPESTPSGEGAPTGEGAPAAGGASEEGVNLIPPGETEPETGE